MKHVPLFIISFVAASTSAGLPASTDTGAPTALVASFGLHELAKLDPPVCGRLVVHANAAIAGVLHDDGAIRLAIGRLRSIDVPSPEIVARRNALVDLERLAADVVDHARGAGAEIRRLRDAAGFVSNPGAGADATADANAAGAASSHSPELVEEAHPSDLHTFVDALDDALGRQRKIASDLASFTANLENREMRDDSTPDDGLGRPAGASNASSGFGSAARPAVILVETHQISPHELASSAANDFESRSADIRREEAKAAEVSEAAVAGCP